jgi:hypothetical protein
MTEELLDTSAVGKSPKNLQDIKKHLKDGEEPTELLLSLVSSPLIDLKSRALAKIVTAEENGRKVVLAIFYDAVWVDGKGIVQEQSVGKKTAAGGSVGKTAESAAENE